MIFLSLRMRALTQSRRELRAEGDARPGSKSDAELKHHLQYTRAGLYGCGREKTEAETEPKRG